MNTQQQTKLGVTVMPQRKVRRAQELSPGEIGFFPQYLDWSTKSGYIEVWAYCKGFGPNKRKGFRTIEECEQYLSENENDKVYTHRIKEAVVI